MSSVSIVFIEVKKSWALGRARLDVIAQVLAESAGMSNIFVQPQILMTLLIILACDYLNAKAQHWVPILAVLCDGNQFEFMVYESGVKSIYSSGEIPGVSDFRNNPDLLAPSLKRSKVASSLPLFQY